MPRSNKKKHLKKPPPKSPPQQSMFILPEPKTYYSDDRRSTSPTHQLLSNETSKMLSRAIKSGTSHGINLEPGSSNQGKGDCAFEAAIQNNNDRPCFKEKFLMPINHYRRLWVTDMANRTLNSDYNILTHQEWLDGWKPLLIPGNYERGIFGDLMIPGIACGIKKWILIFNTNENSPHDPIYVVNPHTFNVEPDTAIPIVLAYNMVHYESLHPCTQRDTQATVNLVRAYVEGRYNFGKQHIPFLLGLDMEQVTDSKSKHTEMLKSTSPVNIPDQTTIEDFIEEKFNTPQRKAKLDGNFLKDVIDLEEIDDFLDHENELKHKNGTALTNLCYKLHSEEMEHPIQVNNGWSQCPFCNVKVKNIKLHFLKTETCGKQIELDHFLKTYERYEKEVKNEKARQKMRMVRNRKKHESEEAYEAMKEQNRQNNRNLRERRKNESEESFEALKEQNRQDIRNMRERRKNESGPIFICSCCKRKLFKNGVTKINERFREIINSKKQGLFELIIPRQVHIKIILDGSDDLSGYYICHTCKSSLSQGKCPSMAETNGLILSKLHEDCHLTELENNLIAQIINFQYIYFLQKSRWAATKKQMISVPVIPETISETMNQLPRLPKEAGLLPIQLKRKKAYEGSHKTELIDPDKINRVMALLKISGNKYYQFHYNQEEYKTKCKENELETSSDDEELESENEEEIKERTYITEDPVRKHQFDHSRNTCMTNDYPEISVDDNGRRNITKEDFSFAPAEGNQN